MGECYFKKGDLELALDCFEKVIKLNGKEKKALRNASIMLRSIQTTSEQRQKNIIRSMELAKKAVECDFEDKESWAILGNAYLTILFLAKKCDKPEVLKRCKMAYQKALMDRIVKTKSDVLFNYSSVLIYDEEFDFALKCLTEAYIYDPDWNELKMKKEQLISLIKEINSLKIDKTVIKVKQLKMLKDQLKSEEENLKKIYGNCDKYFAGHTKSIEELTDGFNDCLLICKIVSYVNDNENILFCSVYYLIDSFGHSISLFLYDINKNKGPRTGDSVLIIRPFVKNYQIKHEQDEYRFRAIKINDPINELLVNNCPINIDCLTRPTINITFKSD